MSFLHFSGNLNEVLLWVVVVVLCRFFFWTWGFEFRRTRFFPLKTHRTVQDSVFKFFRKIPYRREQKVWTMVFAHNLCELTRPPAPPEESTNWQTGQKLWTILGREKLSRGKMIRVSRFFRGVRGEGSLAAHTEICSNILHSTAVELFLRVFWGLAIFSQG